MSRYQRIFPDRRYGHFTLTNDLIRDYPVSIRMLMGTLIPAKMEQNACIDALEGWAWCPDFDETQEGMMATDYVAVLRSDGKIAWRRA